MLPSQTNGSRCTHLTNGLHPYLFKLMHGAHAAHSTAKPFCHDAAAVADGIGINRTGTKQAQGLLAELPALGWGQNKA